MFGFCRDPLSTELHKRGYNLVRLPEASIRARELVGRKGRELFRIGDLLSLFESEQGAPEIKDDVTVAPIDVTETGRLDGRLGAKIVAAMLGGDKAGLEGRLGKTRRFKLKIAEIKKQYIELGELDKFLGPSKLIEGAATVEQLMTADALYLVTAVLKTPSVSLESQTADKIGAGLDVTEVHSGVSGSVKVQVDEQDSTRIFIKSDKPVVFAFQAAKLLFNNGSYVCFDPDLGRLQLLGGKKEAPREPRLVDELGVGSGIVGIGE